MVTSTMTRISCKYQVSEVVVLTGPNGIPSISLFDGPTQLCRGRLDGRNAEENSENGEYRDHDG